MTGKAGVLHLHVGDGERGLALIREALSISEIPARVFHPTGDLLLLSIQAERDEVLAWLEASRAQDWRPGDPVPDPALDAFGPEPR